MSVWRMWLTLVATAVVRSVDGLVPKLPVQESRLAAVPYSEVPCELQPLSSWLDPQGNLWGVGRSDVWWYNVTTHAWSFVPLANGTAGPWRVMCGDPEQYLAVRGGDILFVLHLQQHHWQEVKWKDGDPALDYSATWCSRNKMFALNLRKGDLSVLEPEPARWKQLLELDVDEMNVTTRQVATWAPSDGGLYLYGAGNSSQMWSADANGAGWTLVGQQKAEGWPLIDDDPLTWADGDRLWLWRSNVTGDDLWMFSLTTATWQQVPVHRTAPLSSNRLATWVDGPRLCVLSTSRPCPGQYTPTMTWCLNTELNTTTTDDQGNQSSATVTQVISPPPTAAPTRQEVLHVSQLQKSTPASSSPPPVVWHPRQFVSKTPVPHTPPERLTPHEAVAAPSPPWHQEHSSVFGSVIFFGTSLTIFAIVGIIWCVRRCVHFPKEALLLRDPPSVRYTAIPDSVA